MLGSNSQQIQDRGVEFAFFGEPLAALAGHQHFAALLGFFLAAALNVCGTVPLGR